MPDKDRERYYFDALRKALSELPAGDPSEPEPPDFLLQDQRDRLGIELTSFHLPAEPGQRPHQERQSLKDQIVARAQRLHEEAGGPALYVGVYFNAYKPIAKRDIQPLAHAIAQSVLRAPMPRSMNEPVELPWGSRPEATSGIQIHPSVDGKDKLWHADAGGWVADITSAHIAAVLSSKARRALLARARCDRLWLVIVHDLFSRAAPAEITLEALAAEYEAPFDRVLWFTPTSPSGPIDLKLRRRLPTRQT